MAQKHRPDFEAIRREGPQVKAGKGTKFRDSYMFPYMNIEDLARGKSLLLFLNSRGRNPPRVFAHADFEAVHLGLVSAAVLPPFLNLHTMSLEGESVETYGRLVSWDDDEEAMQMVFTRLAHQPGEGLLILEAQQRILQFLNDCCRVILHDIDAEALVSNELPVKPEPQLIADSADWPTLASMAAEAPYRVPAQIDFQRLKAVIDAKRSDAEDHIRSLREDPGYFADVIQDWSDHRQETLLDTNGSRHPVLDKPLFWDRVLGNVVSDAYGTLIAWSIISQQLATLSSLQEKYSAIISPKKKLPEEYTKALLRFQHTLDEVKKVPISNLKMGLPASTYFRSFFDREPQSPGSTMIYLVGRRSLAEDHVWWLFSRLWDKDQLFLLGFPNVMDELEKIIQSDTKEKQKLSSWVARIFSELGVMARARHELDIYMPWAAGFESDKVAYEEVLKVEFPLIFAPIAEFDRHLKNGNLSFAKSGSPKGDTFYYPAERNLDVFWETVDGHYKKTAGKSLYEAFRYLLASDEPLERTPEWLEPTKETKTPNPTSESNSLERQVSQLHVDNQGQPGSFIPSPRKVKPKTRGQTSTAEGTVAEKALPDQERGDTQPTFTVVNRAFKVFKVLFYTPSTNDLPGEIAWADFLFAMAATGFAPEKLYGSIWQFTPLTLDVERSIQFHEPHPRSKIPFRNARRIGRRLSRAYGWHGGLFVQAS